MNTCSLCNGVNRFVRHPRVHDNENLEKEHESALAAIGKCNPLF